MPEMRSSNIHEARPPLVKERNPVIGYDSLGTAIRRGDRLLAQMKDKTDFTAAQGFGLLDSSPSIKLFDDAEGQVVKAGIDSLTVMTGGQFALKDLMQKEEPYWKELDAFIYDEERLAHRPRAEDWYNSSFPFFHLQGHAGKTIGEQTLGYISRTKKNGNTYEIDILFPGSRMPFKINLHSGEITTVSGSSLISVVRGRSGEDYLTVSNIYLPHSVDEKGTTVLERDRLSSEADVVEKLRVDFPWVTEKDIHATGATIPTTLFKRQRTGVDKMRIARLYDDQSYAGRIIGSLNAYEEEYLAARNYLHLVEFASFAETAEDSPERIMHMEPDEKSRMVERFLIRVQEEKDALLSKRREREAQLFGFDVTDALAQYPLRMVSEDTIAPDSYLGLHTPYEGISLLVDKGRKYYHEGDIHKKFAEVVSHEEGHYGGAEAKKIGWNHEELWTEWYSNVYPRALQGQQPYGDVSYHYEVLHDHDHYFLGTAKYGAFELQRVFEEMMSLARGGKAFAGRKKLTTSDIERSAIATYIKRADRGRLKVGKVETVGFADLYDEVMYNAKIDPKHIAVPYTLAKLTGHLKDSFNHRFSRCTDELYRREREGRKEEKVQAGGAPAQKSAWQQIYEAIFAEKIEPALNG